MDLMRHFPGIPAKFVGENLFITNVASYSFLAFAAVLILRYGGIFAFEVLVDRTLRFLNTGVLSNGKSISGPRWTIPNGQVIDKLLNGAQKSTEWRKFGPVYRIWAGSYPEIVITTPEHLKIFHSDSEKHGKPRWQNLGWFVGQVLGRCVGLLEGEEWKHRRQVFDPPFRHGAAIARIADTETAAKAFVNELPLLKTANGESKAQNITEKEKQSSESFTLHAVSAFMKFPFFLTAGVVYGEMDAQEKQELWNLAEKHMALLPYFVIGGPYRFAQGRWVHPSAYRKLRGYQAGWKDCHERMVQRRRSRGIRVPLVEYWEEYEAGHITLDDFLHTMDEMLMANLDVTTHILTWCITLIADNESVQKELREEVAANKTTFQSYLTKTDTHLHRCFYESLRLRPLAVFSIGESAPSVKDFNGILVKPNTMVVVDVLAINVRNPFWGPDSANFNPARFKTIKQSDLRYNLTVFGFGHRKCMGQYIGAHMIKAAVAHLFDQYEVLVTDGRKSDGDYKIHKDSWVPMADVRVQLTKLQK
ncbi:cytochrome P450 [Lepidopterella palustris CBS 459.81]|uniref:Cytochrome P450 n=1 Tax=Lepidopterella palustris CBS 459.81 TaxID=1314670 RepID=A0A8E2E4U8_9PEZI|nr:cytochrome P450 [Lepidopterella palustris CBS 459.81]